MIRTFESLIVLPLSAAPVRETKFAFTPGSKSRIVLILYRWVAWECVSIRVICYSHVHGSHKITVCVQHRGT